MFKQYFMQSYVLSFFGKFYECFSISHIVKLCSVCVGISRQIGETRPFSVNLKLAN